MGDWMWYCSECKTEVSVIAFVGELGEYSSDTKPKWIAEDVRNASYSVRCVNCDSDCEWHGKLDGKG
jgi:hypothetical protein